MALTVGWLSDAGRSCATPENRAPSIKQGSIAQGRLRLGTLRPAHLSCRSCAWRPTLFPHDSYFVFTSASAFRLASYPRCALLIKCVTLGWSYASTSGATLGAACAAEGRPAECDVCVADAPTRTPHHYVTLSRTLSLRNLRPRNGSLSVFASCAVLCPTACLGHTAPPHENHLGCVCSSVVS